MNIQTISIVVPTKGCVNNCPFCVSRMHDSPYENSWDEFQMTKRIQYAIMNKVTTCIITGIGEPLQNRNYLLKLSNLFRKLDNPFPNIEFQTTGIFLSESEKEFDNFVYTKDSKPIYKNIKILQSLGVNTISLSVSDPFDDNKNNAIIGAPRPIHLYELIHLLKDYGFNIRISLNLTVWLNKRSVTDIIERAKFLGADQLTFRKLYCPDDNEFTDQGYWVKENSPEPDFLGRINDVIKSNGKPLYRLPFGPMVYSIWGMSTVVDDDCMNKTNKDTLKYIILRENGKLYSQWDDVGSLIF